MKRTVQKVVLDTNIVVSALIFSQTNTARLRTAWQNHLFQPLISKPTATELMRVLAYPKFKLTAEEQTELLADYLPWCKTIHIPTPAPATPECRDAFDIPFLQLAVAGKAHYLITGDKDLLVIRKFACPILRLDDFLVKAKIK